MLPCVIYEKKLGNGGQGRVYKAQPILLDKIKRVGKSICVKKAKRGGNDGSSLTTESTVLRCLRPVKGVRSLLWDGIDRHGEPILYLEYVPYTLLEKREWAKKNRKNFLLQLLTAVAHLHEREILHGDIKPSNILVTEDLTLKLSDFGSARFFWEAAYDLSFHERTLLYSPPEYVVEKNHPIHEKGDIYSLGVTILSVLKGNDQAFLVDDLHDKDKIRQAIRDMKLLHLEAADHKCKKYMGEATYIILSRMLGNWHFCYLTSTFVILTVAIVNS